MNQSCNIYQKARNAKGVSQERAAEMLNISVRALAGYETGERFPPDHVVVGMVDLYDNQLLAVQHLRQSAYLANCILPDVPDLCLSQAALTLIDAVYDFADDKLDRQLIEIARDGVIAEDERPQFEKIVQKISEITSAAYALVYAREENSPR